MPRIRRLTTLTAMLASAVTALVLAATAAAADQWGAPATLSDGTRSALGVAVADAAGAAPIAAWHESDGRAFQIRAARFVDGAWTPSQRLSRKPVEPGTIRIAANRWGEAVAIWRSAADRDVMAARYADGRWSRPFEVAGARSQSARVAIEPDGMATIAWVQPDAEGIRRVRAVRVPGVEPGEPAWVSPADQPVLPVAYLAAGGANGRVHLVWIADREGPDTIEVASFRGGWGAPATWSNPARDADLPRIAASRDGDVAVTWVEAVRGGQAPFARLLDNGRLRPAQVIGPAVQRIPQITVAAGGAERVAIAWTALDGDAVSVGAALHDPLGWADPLTIADADAPQTAMSTDGRTILAYRGVRDGVDDVLARFGEGRSWGEPTRIGTTGAIYGPRVTVGPSGAPTAIWTTPGADGGPDVAVAARETSHLKPSPTPHLDEIVGAIRAMERRTGSDSSEAVLWQATLGNALDGAGTEAPAWLVRTQDCWGRTDVCSSAAAQERMLGTIRSIIANAETTIDVSSLAGIADGGFRAALIAGVREADAAGRRPVVRMVWGHQPAAPFPVTRLRALHRDLKAAAPNLRIVVALHKNTLILNGFSWNHSKIVAADGRVAYASGINMWSKSYLQSTNPVTDVGVVVRGPAATSAHRFLDVLWTELCRHPRWSPRFSNTLVPTDGGPSCPARRAPAATAPVGDVAVLAVGRAGYSDTGRVVGTRDPQEVSKEDRRDGGCIIPPLPNTMNGDPAWDGNNPSDTALRALVRSATERVVIGQQEATFGCAREPSYDVRLYDELARKVADGVPVTIVVSNENGGISTLEGYSAKPPDTMKVMKRRLAKLLGSEAAATRAACASLTVARFRYSDAATWPNGKQPALHGKVIAVDDEAFYVGSQNAYPNQLQEFGYIIEDPRAMADFKRDYLDPMVRYSSQAALSCR